MPEDDKKKKKGDSPKDGDDTPKGDVVSMTQDELDQRFAQRADRASRSAVSSLLGDLGYEDTNALKEALSSYEVYLDTQKSEGERLTDELAVANTKVTELSADLTASMNELQEYKLKTTLLSEARDARFIQDSLDDVWMFVQNGELKDGLKIDPETGVVNGAKAVVKKVAEKRPHWVQQEVRKGTPSPRGASAPGAKPTGKKEEPVRPLVNF